MNTPISKKRYFPINYTCEIQQAPYYAEEHGILFNSTFQKVLGTLRSNSIDLIVTDPPYGINYRGCKLNQKKQQSKTQRANNRSLNLIINDSPNASLIQFKALVMYAKRLLRPGCCCCICCPGGAKRISILEKWLRELTRFLELKELVIWNKGGLGLGCHYRQNYEYIIVAKKPGSVCKWNASSGVPNIVSLNRIIPRKGDHPTPKPTELMAHFIRLHSHPGDLVMDPLAGHGPTLIAAKKERRKFIGIETELKYCEAIVQRLNAET